MSQVTILQRILPHYRVPFFDALAQLLRRDGLTLKVLYGAERPGTVPRSQCVERDWALPIANRYWLGGRLVWQPWQASLGAGELVITEHANSLTLTHRLLAQRLLRREPRLAFWGHGRNLQRSAWLADRYKAWMARRADWWFVYTSAGADGLAAQGVPRARITVVNNSIDTSALAGARASIGAAECAALRATLGLAGTNVGIFCGGMYAEKRLDFLVHACRLIRERLADFELIAIGEGPEQATLERAAAQHPWIHYVGARFGAELAPYLSLARVFLMPGLVGLAVIDSFAAGVPMVTTDIPIHSPEIAYLMHGENGLMSADDPRAYAGVVCELLESEPLRRRLLAGCARAADTYSLAAMAARYADGIAACLGQRTARPWLGRARDAEPRP